MRAAVLMISAAFEDEVSPWPWNCRMYPTVLMSMTIQSCLDLRRPDGIHCLRDGKTSTAMLAMPKRKARKTSGGKGPRPSLISGTLVPKRVPAIAVETSPVLWDKLEQRSPYGSNFLGPVS